MNADKNPDPPSSPSEGSISNEEDKDMYDSCDGDDKEISANVYICLGTSEDAGSFLSAPVGEPERLTAHNQTGYTRRQVAAEPARRRKKYSIIHRKGLLLNTFY